MNKGPYIEFDIPCNKYNWNLPFKLLWTWLFGKSLNIKMWLKPGGKILFDDKVLAENKED